MSTSTAPHQNTSVVPSADENQISNRALVGWMFEFVRPVKWMAARCCLYLAAAVGIEVIAVNTTGKAINQIRDLAPGSNQRAGFWEWILGSSADAAGLRWVMLTLVLLVLGILILRYVREVANTKLSMDMVFFLRSAVYDKLQKVGFKFHDVISSGQLINRALTDLQNVRGFLQTAILMTLEIVLIVGGYMILILTKSPSIAMLSLIPLPFWVWYIIRFGKAIRPASKAVMDTQDKNVSIITENIAGVHVVKAFATEKVEINKYAENCREFFDKVMMSVRMLANFTPVMRAIGTASHLSLFLAAAVLIIKGQGKPGSLQVGDFLILGAAMGAILGRLQQVSAINEQYQNAIVSARRLYEVLMAPPTVAEKLDATPLPAGAGAVRFDNVTFGYDQAKPVLQDVTFDVAGGSVVAFVGPTGSGKTTLVNLLARFYDPSNGTISIDGVDLRDLTLSTIRRSVAFVFQETYLFSDTVEANIAYGRPGTTGGEVEAAARLAQAHDFIEGLPQGYKTILGERGTSLSGGQKQRLAIARAILFDPRILVLDDATASVDPETEDLIRRGMNYVMTDRTTFVIAHRISTVKRADLVIVLEHGHVTQMGTHAALMSEPGHYREIAAVQLYGDDVARMTDAPSHMDRMKDPGKVAQQIPAVLAARTMSTTVGSGQPVKVG